MFNWNIYDYSLPKNLLAKTPATPRDTSRLFIYNSKTDSIKFDRFFNLDKYLPKKSFLVLNDTKVLPARIELGKQNGGKVICLLLLNELTKLRKNNLVKALVDRKTKIGEKLFIDNTYYFEVIDQNNKIFLLKFKFSPQLLYRKLIKKGKTPVPLYLRKTPLNEKQLRKKYQTIFAKKGNIGSVAAPTASLHFSGRVFAKLEKRKIEKFFITLQVGLGTFAPLEKENLFQKKLPAEIFKVTPSIFEKLKKLKFQSFKLVASGTTTVRALESKFSGQNGSTGKTELFIFPPYKFKMVDILLTNFHLPRSSLMLLVEAFLQYKKAKKHLVDLYKIAIKEKFRFYSFGDAMLIL